MSTFDDEYATRPTRVRVYHESDGWNVDGVDRSGRHTEACARFTTEEEARAAVPAFVAAHFSRLTRLRYWITGGAS